MVNRKCRLPAIAGLATAAGFPDAPTLLYMSSSLWFVLSRSANDASAATQREKAKHPQSVNKADFVH